MNSMNFIDRLAEAVERTGNAVCVGLDPRWKNLPERFRHGVNESYDVIARAFRGFCNSVTDVVSPLVPIVKVQTAFFEELGSEGMAAMRNVVEHAQSRGLLVIVDAKRNDIGSTA